MYSFDYLKDQLQIYDTNGNDEQLFNNIIESNTQNYKIVFDTYLVRNEKFFDNELPFYKTIKNLNNQIDLTKQDFDKIYESQLMQENGRSFGFFTVKGLFLILITSIIISIMIIIIK